MLQKQEEMKTLRSLRKKAPLEVDLLLLMVPHLVLDLRMMELLRLDLKKTLQHLKMEMLLDLKQMLPHLKREMLLMLRLVMELTMLERVILLLKAAGERDQFQYKGA